MSVEKIRERAEAATEGPFEVASSPRYERTAVVNHRTKLGTRMNLMSVAGRNTPVLQLPDAELLAHAREDILTLLGLLDGVREHAESMNADIALADRSGMRTVSGFLRKYTEPLDIILASVSDG